MRVLIYEPVHTGHRFAYVGLMLAALKRLGDRVKPVLGTMPAAVASEQFRMFLGPVADGVEIDDGIIRPGSNGLRGLVAAADQFIDCVARSRADHVMVPYADGLSQALVLRAALGRRALPKGVASEALFLRGGFAYPTTSLRQRVVRELSWRMAQRSPYSRIHHLDAVVYDWVRQHCGAGSGAWRMMPDPVTAPDPASARDRLGARGQLGLAGDGRIVGCVGLIDERKGVDLLCRAFSRARLPATDRLLLVGSHHQAVRDVLRGECADLVAAGRIVSIDRFVSQAEMDAAVAAMDLVCTPYPDHIGSASIVTRAAAAGRPVLSSDFGWVARTVTQFGLGWTCAVRDAEAFPRALEAALAQAEDWRLGEGGRRYVEYQSTGNFERCWMALLRERLGLPEEPMLRTWEWVVEAACG